MIYYDFFLIFNFNMVEILLSTSFIYYLLSLFTLEYEIIYNIYFNFTIYSYILDIKIL